MLFENEVNQNQEQRRPEFRPCDQQHNGIKDRRMKLIEEKEELFVPGFELFEHGG